MSTFQTFLAQVEAEYIGYFDRAGDPTGTQYWEGQLQSNALNVTGLAASFSVQLEAQQTYSFLATGGSSSVTAIQAFITQVYQNLFNRAPDASGLAYWTAQLQASSTPAAIGQFIQNVISGATAGGADDLTLQGKVAVAASITSSAQTTGFTWNNAAAAESRALIAATTSANVTTQEAAWTTYLADQGYGANIFNFTTGVDFFTTAATGAIFNASPAQFVPLLGIGIPANTLSVNDYVNDTAGDGTLNFTTSPSLVAAAINPSYVTNITMAGVATANITNSSGFGVIAGFQGGAGTTGPAGGPTPGTITGLTTVNDVNSIGPVILGGTNGTNQGLSTLLKNVNIFGFDGGNGCLVFQEGVSAAIASATATINVAITGNLGATTLASANILSFSNDSSVAGTTTAPNLTYGTMALTLNSNVDLTLTANGGFGSAFGTANVTGFTGITLAGAGNVALTTDAAGNFGLLKSVNASASTGNVVITGAASNGVVGQTVAAAAGAYGNTLASVANVGWVFGANATATPNGLPPTTSGSGLLTGDAVFNSFVGTTTGSNILDVSGLTLAQFAAGTFTGNTTAGKVNQLIVNNAVATTTLATTFANDTGWQQLDIGGPALTSGWLGTINMKNLPSTINDLFVLTTAQAGALAVTNQVSALTIDLEDGTTGANTLTVGGPAAAPTGAPGLADSLTLVIGDATQKTGDAIGAVTIFGDELFTITANGGTKTADATGLVTLSPTTIGNEQVTFTGNTPLTIAGLQDVNFVGGVPASLITNNMIITDNDTGVVTLGSPGGLLSFVPSFDAAGADPLFFSTNAFSIDATNSGGIIMTAGDANFTVSTTVAGSVGDTFKGSATAATGSVFGGSIGNDTYTLQQGASGEQIYTNGGADTVNLFAGHTGVDNIDLYPAFTTPGVTPSGSVLEIVRDFGLTTGADIPRLGWWGNPTGPAAAPTGYAGTVYDGLLANTGTSLDISTVNGFVAAQDVLNFATSLTFNGGWGTGGVNGNGGAVHGIVDGDLVTHPAVGVAVIQQLNPGGTVLAGTNIIELTGSNFANANAVVQSLHSVVAYNIAFSNAAVGANDSFHVLVAYQDLTGTNVNVMDLAITDTAGAAGITTAGATTTLHGSDMVHLTGVSLVALTAADFGFVAGS